MPLGENTIAAGVGSAVKNVQHKTSADVLDRKQLIFATFDPLKTAVVADEPVLVLSPEDAGDKFGFGFMAHRLALKNNLGAQGIPTWIMPQDEAGGAAASAGEIDFTGSTGVVAGQMVVYIAGDPIPTAITTGMTVEEIADEVVAKVNADPDTPVIAAKTAVTFEVTFDAKSKGPYGDDIDLSLDIGPSDVTPVGITAVITAMTGGTGIPVMADSLAALGTGDNANEGGFTDCVHGYGLDTTTLDAILTYVGAGNDFTGLYSKTVARPFRFLTGDVTAGSGGLSALIVISDTRLTDRAQGVIAVPGSQSHPSEIAAQAIGFAARVNDNLGQGDYVNGQLIGVQPGAKADRWTADYDNRDTAVKSGIGTSLVRGGVVFIQDLVTFYRPASVPVASNGFRDFADISRTQNILNSQFLFFLQEQHQNLIIVEDVATVTNPAVREKVRDVSTQTGFVVQLVRSWAEIGWIASADFTINQLKQGGFVTIRVGGDGFIINIPVIYSGDGKITDVTTQFDTSFAALQ